MCAVTTTYVEGSPWQINTIPWYQQGIGFRIPVMSKSMDTQIPFKNGVIFGYNFCISVHFLSHFWLHFLALLFLKRSSIYFEFGLPLLILDILLCHMISFLNSKSNIKWNIHLDIDWHPRIYVIAWSTYMCFYFLSVPPPLHRHHHNKIIRSTL